MGGIPKEVEGKKVEERKEKRRQKAVSEIRKIFETNHIKADKKETPKEGKVKGLVEKFQKTEKKVVRGGRIDKEIGWKEVVRDKSGRKATQDGGRKKEKEVIIRQKTRSPEMEGTSRVGLEGKERQKNMKELAEMDISWGKIQVWVI